MCPIPGIPGGVIKAGVITIDTLTRYELGTLPLFLLMAHVFFAVNASRDMFDAAARFIRSIADLGFGAVREVGQWVIAGALVVVPLWLLMRLFASRR